MNRYRYFILEAKINSAEGFGHPATNASSTPVRKRKPPTKEELGRWRARSDKFREDYLKKHPNSKFKDVPVRGNIVTRSKKVSSKPWAKEMSEHGVEALRNIGLKGNKIKYVAGKVAAGALSKFMKTKDRKPFLETAKKVFNNYRNKLKPEDREELDKEAEQINNSDVAPSRTILRKAGKGLIFGLVGLAAGAAMYSGIIPADIAVYLGVKILDTSFETAKHSLREPLSTLIVANTISKFFNSSDSDDYADSTLKNMKRKGYEPEDETDEDAGDNLNNKDIDKSDEVDTEQKTEEAKPPEESEEEKLKRIVEQRLGKDFDSSKYYLDENGDLKLKSRKPTS